MAGLDLSWLLQTLKGHFIVMQKLATSQSINQRSCMTNALETVQDKVFKRPPAYAYISWYVLLFAWVQGIVTLHIGLLLCLLLSLRFIPQAISKLKNIPWLWIPVACYEVIRIISSMISDHPEQAFIGIFDDVRAIIFGLLALVFLNNKQDLKHAAWITFAAFTFLAYWTLGYHLLTHDFSLQPTVDIVLGTLGSVNYAAAITTIAMLSMIAAALLLPCRSARWMLLGIIPLIILQIPLGSRTTILVTIILLFMLIIFLRAWKASFVIASLIVLIIGGLTFTSTGLSQLPSLSQSEKQLHGNAGLPSLQIRWEIFQVLSHLSLQHILGLGPRNHGYVDLNAERSFLKEHAKTICKYVYGFTTDSEKFKHFDFNNPILGGNTRLTADPHSQYTIVISETGPLGLILLFLIYAGLIRYSIPLILTQSSYQYRLFGISSMLMLAVFILSGLTVVLIYQAGNLILFGYIAILACYHNTTHQLARDST